MRTLLLSPIISIKDVQKHFKVGKTKLSQLIQTGVIDSFTSVHFRSKRFILTDSCLKYFGNSPDQDTHYDIDSIPPILDLTGIQRWFGISRTSAYRILEQKGWKSTTIGSDTTNQTRRIVYTDSVIDDLLGNTAHRDTVNIATPEKVLSLSEAASTFPISKSWLKNLIQNGSIKKLRSRRRNCQRSPVTISTESLFEFFLLTPNP